MPRVFLSIAVSTVILLAGCTGASEVRGFWKDIDITVTEDNYRSSQDRFAQYAELLVAAPQKEAAGALGELFKKLRTDEVSYYVYSEWMESAFHNYLSPCRNADLFEIAVRHISSDGIMNKEEVARLQKLAAMDALNRTGDPCTVPAGAETDGAALYLVLDLDCRTCLQSLAAMSEAYPEAEHIALCFGYSRTPELPGWKYLRPADMKDIFELDAAPFWFLTDASGKVTIPYSKEYDAPQFASPEEP